MNKKYLVIIFVTIAVIFTTAIYFYRGRIVSQESSLQLNTISTSTVFSPKISLMSPDGNKIIFYDEYNSYPHFKEPYTIFTIKNLKNGQENKIQFFGVLNLGRYIDQWYWIDDQYVLVSGDGLISILDTINLKQGDILMGLDPKISKNKKMLTYTEIVPPLYGPLSGKTKLKTLPISFKD